MNKYLKELRPLLDFEQVLITQRVINRQIDNTFQDLKFSIM